MSESSFKWFKSIKEKIFGKKKEERPILPIREDVLSTLNEISSALDITPKVVVDSPLRSVVLTNNTLTAFLKNGNIISTSNGDKDLYKKVWEAETERDIIGLISPESLVAIEVKEKEVEKHKEILKAFDALKKYPDFEVGGDDTVRFTGINRTIPPLLANKFMSVLAKENSPEVEVEYQSLKRFWFWCCLNPRAEVADMLYGFLEKNCLRLNKQGFFYALRNVVKVEGMDTSLVDFISNTYTHIKAVWKKLPRNYEVWRNDDKEEGFTFKSVSKPNFRVEEREKTWELIGNLEDLYKDLPNMKENRYTDQHTGTFDIRVGKVVNMPKEECDWSTVDCGSSGLHFTLDQINYVGCGDTSVLVLINPSKVVGIGTHKGRCWEYLPIMTVPRDEVTQILHDEDFDTLQLDEWYAKEEVEDLENKAREGFAAEKKKYSFNIPTMGEEEFQFIVKSLEEIKEELKDRVMELV